MTAREPSRPKRLRGGWNASESVAGFRRNHRLGSIGIAGWFAPEYAAIDLEVYKWRHLIENFFCKLKEFKRVAMRSDKTDTSFAAMIYLGAAIINSR